jgi:hypothetical protein
MSEDRREPEPKITQTRARALQGAPSEMWVPSQIMWADARPSLKGSVPERAMISRRGLDDLGSLHLVTGAASGDSKHVGHKQERSRSGRRAAQSFRRNSMA